VKILCLGWKKFFLTDRLTNFRTVYHDSVENKLYLGGVNNLYEFDSENITEPLNVVSYFLNWQQKLYKSLKSFKKYSFKIVI